MATTALNARPKRRSRRRPDQESAHDFHAPNHEAHTVHESHFTPGSVLYLQQIIGNQAVQRLMRQDVDTVGAPPTAGLLDAAQVSKALAFYKAQPARYTPDIIMEIQFAVGSVPTGKMIAADVQLVAKKQEELNVDAEPKLKIDGMAGPRTLPTIFKFGLAEDDSISDYTKKAKAVWDNKDGKSEEDKAREVVNDLLNKRLQDLNIPIVKVELIETSSRGFFNSANWTLTLDTKQFQKGSIFHDLRETTATIYHEGRHAEQDFRVGQMLARNRRMQPDAIAVETHMDKDVAQKAFDTKDSITPMQAVIAEGWFDSFHGEGKAAFARNNAKLEATARARSAACKAFKDDPSPANKAKLEKAKAEFKEAVDEHDQLPHEFDAERIEDKIKRLFGPGEEHDDVCKL